MPRAILLGLFYCSVFIGTGASLPYMPVWFKAHGLSGAEIGIILSGPMMVRMFVTPVLALWADGFVLRRSPLILFGLATGLTYGAIGLVTGFTPWLLLWVAGSSLLSTVIPLADVLTLRRSRAEGFNYGVPRGIGSIAFVVANIGMGALLTKLSVDVIIVWIFAAGLLTGLSARVLLPPDPVHENGEKPDRADRWRGMGALLRNRPFLTAVLSTSLIQATHAFYYSFSTLLWQGQGLSETVIGLLWATGVAAEIGFMWFLEPWRRRVGAETLVMIGGLAALVRWTAFAFSPPLWLLFPLQMLHALTFAATFMGSLLLIERNTPPHQASIAQTMSSAVSGGLIIGLATVASGTLFDLAREQGYLGMSLLAVLGMLGAWRLTIARRGDGA